MELADFPPFYTLQPVEGTREKQIELWKEMILRDCIESCTRIDLRTFPAFTNQKINRSLNEESRRVIGDSLVLSGFASWEDPKVKYVLKVYSKTPESLASIVYNWAKETARVGGEISTFYEIHSGEDATTQLAGVNEGLLMEALNILEKQKKVILYPGAAIDEMGIKFL